MTALRFQGNQSGGTEGKKDSGRDSCFTFRETFHNRTSPVEKSWMPPVNNMALRFVFDKEGGIPDVCP